MIQNKKDTIIKQLTRNNVKRDDNFVFNVDSFKNCDNVKVPFIYQFTTSYYIRNNEVLGSAILHNKEDGVYAEISFYDTDLGMLAKTMLTERNDFTVGFCAIKINCDGDKVVKSGIIRAVYLIPEDRRIKYDDEFC